MKISLAKSQRKDGSAVIVVLVLMFIMVAYLTLNSRTLLRMKRSIQSIEHRELKKYGKPAGSAAIRVTGVEANRQSELFQRRRCAPLCSAVPRKILSSVGAAIVALSLTFL